MDEPKHMSRREARDLIGYEAELRLAELLRAQGWVSHGIAHESTGINGVPDLLLHTKYYKYGIELKSILPYTASKVRPVYVNHATLDKETWSSMRSWCEDRKHKPLLVVEIRLKSAPNLYYFIEAQTVEGKIEDYQGDPVPFNFYDLPILASQVHRPGVWNRRALML